MNNETFITYKEINEIKIAILSDIHYSYPGFNIQTFNIIEKQIIDAKPDYICIIGDIIDEANIDNLTDLTSFLKKISKISPVLYTMGNHELKILKKHKWFEYECTPLLNEINQIENFYYLNNNKYIDESKNICFYGFNPSFKYYEREHETYESFENEMNKIKIELDKKYYNILLIHTPINIYKYIEKNPNSELNKIDIILSGHMHNSCLPFFLTRFLNSTFKITRGIISPKKHLFPKYSFGKTTKIKNGYIYQGITKLSKTSGYYNLDKLYSKNIETITIKKVLK